MKKLSRYLKTVIGLSAAIAVLILPGFSAGFCDWYTDNIYHTLCDAISRFTALFPFALGEILMYMAGLAGFASVIIIILLIFLRNKVPYVRFVTAYLKTISIIFFSIVLIYIPLWFIPYKGTVLGRGNPKLRTEYSFEEIEELLQHIVNEGNAAAEEIYISEEGKIAFKTREENSILVVAALTELSEEYSRLEGYYPLVKDAICSDILERMNIGGYNYPYTMEPTHNRYIDPLYQPILDAHELSHHKGYYKENEANFISELALSRSEDPYLRLAAYMNMYGYVHSEYLKRRDALSDENVKRRAEESEPKFSERVDMIKEASLEAERAIYESENHILDSFPTLDRFIHNVGDEGWDIQGDIIEDNSYDGVVLLLLQYYFK